MNQPAPILQVLPGMAWHRFLDHTSEITLHVGAPDWPGVLAQAGKGLTELLLRAGSACHGAGRAMSRTAAKKVKSCHEVRKDLERQGIVVHGSSGELAEEAPHAYKDVDRVVQVVHDAGLARKVARLRPVGVIKG